MNAPIKIDPSLNIPVRVFKTPTSRGHEPRKILLFKLDHIGDFITALKAFRLMRNAFADAEITLICLPALELFARSTGLFDIVKGFRFIPDSNQHGRVAVPSNEELALYLKSLLDEPYFLAVDFKHEPFNRFEMDVVDATYRAAFGSMTKKGIDITIPTMEWDTPMPATGPAKNLPVHAEVRLTLLAHTVIEMLNETVLDVGRFKLPSDQSNTVPQQALKAQRRLKIGLSVGAGSALRQWDVRYWSSLLQRMHKEDQAYFVFFGSELDQPITERLVCELPAESVLNLTKVLTLDQVPSYLALCDAYIGCDTGLTHLAANLGVPTVNIFAGVSNVSVWRSKGLKVQTLYAEVPCGPCHLRFREDCPNNNVCMGALVPGMVYACFKQVIAA